MSVTFDRMIDGVPIVLVENGHVLEDRLHQTRVREEEMWRKFGSVSVVNGPGSNNTVAVPMKNGDTVSDGPIDVASGATSWRTTEERTVCCSRSFATSGVPSESTR